MITSVSALDSLGTVSQGDKVQVCQVCSDATYITHFIKFPNSTFAVQNINLTAVGNGLFCKEFNQTIVDGRYDVIGISDGCDKTFATFFNVSLNGKDAPEGIVIVIFSLIFIGIVGFGIVYFIKALGHVMELDMDIIDTAVLISTYLALFIFTYFAKEYLANAVVNDLLGLALSIGAYTHIFFPVVGFLVSFILTNLKFKQKSQITY
jgi:hypothetical protein